MAHPFRHVIIIMYIAVLTLVGCESGTKELPHSDAPPVVATDSPAMDRAIRTITENPTPPEIVKTADKTSEAQKPLPKTNVSNPKPAPKKVAVDKDYLLGRFDFTNHPDFEAVESPYTNKSKGEVYLRKETYSAFKQMYDAAAKDGIRLTVLSGTRNFDRQKQIWEGKWKGRSKQFKTEKELAENILKYSSMPSTSRHHWGTDIDLNDLNDASFTKGEGKKVYEWLLAHAGEYGFCNVYSAGRPTGYHEEKWHWSYMPLSSGFLAQYLATITLDDIQGFDGSQTKTELNVIQNYVGGINPNCN